MVVNKTHQEFGEPYGTALTPIGVRKPKEKGSVGGICEWIALMLSNRVFADLGDLLAAMAEKLDELNSRPFQKRAGSRCEVWESAERGKLFPLTDGDFELARWEERTVSPDHRMLVDGVSCSMPYPFSRQKLRMKRTQIIAPFLWRRPGLPGAALKRRAGSGAAKDAGDRSCGFAARPGVRRAPPPERKFFVPVVAQAKARTAASRVLRVAENLSLRKARCAPSGFRRVLARASAGRAFPPFLLHRRHAEGRSPPTERSSP